MDPSRIRQLIDEAVASGLLTPEQVITIGGLCRLVVAALDPAPTAPTSGPPPAAGQGQAPDLLGGILARVSQYAPPFVVPMVPIPVPGSGSES